MRDLVHHLKGRDASILIVELPVELNHESAEPVRELVRRKLPNRDDSAVVLDFSRVELISSIGVAALLQIHEFAGDRSAPMILAAVSKKHIDFFRMLTIERKFKIAKTVDDAVALIEGPA